MIRFADTSYFFALLIPGDIWHEAALRISKQPGQRIITSQWVLVKLGNSAARSRHRARFVEFVADLKARDDMEIVPPVAIGFNGDWIFITATSTRNGR